MAFNLIQHTSALSSHYDKEAQHYDAFNEVRSASTNNLIANILDKHHVKTVLDLACGTGSQVFWLTDKHFNVVGVDINEKMLSIAQQKANQKSKSIYFKRGDMRSSQMGKFDAVLTIFNAIGHLTKEDFELALQNIHTNLNQGGLYIFDIFNLDYLSHADNITKLTIDWQKKSGNTLAREIQYSTISKDGILTSYDIYHEQVDQESPEISTATQTLQVYNSLQLRNILKKNGFEIIQQIDITGTELKPFETERILTVAIRV